MTDNQTAPDWVLREAAKRCGATTTLEREDYLRWYNGAPFRALCDMIAKHEKEPVDRKVLCAREAINRTSVGPGSEVTACVRAIELYCEGFGE